MGSFECFKTKTHFNSLKRVVGVTALAALAGKLLAIALATAAGGGTPLDLLARVPASVADLGAALLVFEVLRTRRALRLAARSAILVAVSPVLWGPGRGAVRRLGADPGLGLGLAGPRPRLGPGQVPSTRAATWWGSGVPWYGGVGPATIPSGAVAGLSLVTWVVLGSWLVLGWRTVMVEASVAKGSGTAAAGAVDNGGNPAARSATLPPGAGRGSGFSWGARERLRSRERLGACRPHRVRGRGN